MAADAHISFEQVKHARSLRPLPDITPSQPGARVLPQAGQGAAPKVAIERAGQRIGARSVRDPVHLEQALDDVEEIAHALGLAELRVLLIMQMEPHAPVLLAGMS